jgi:HEAT repeat protein
VVVTALALVIATAFPWPPDTDAGGDEERSTDRSVRQQVADRLARVETPEAALRLRLMIDDLDPGVRATAVRALSGRGDQAALATAARWVLSGNPLDRAAGLDALRGARALPPAARTALERALSDADPAVKLTALEVLADKDPRPSLAAVAGTLEDSAAPVRLQAIRLLADTRDPRAALTLLGRTADADRGVRREAISALGALGDERVVPALLRLLDGPMDDLRRAAIAALTSLRAPAAVPPLIAHARRRPADLVARNAQWALGEIATPEAVAALVALLGVPPVPDEVRDALVRAGPRAVPLLIQELEGDPGVATEASALLGQIGDRRAVGPLLALLRRRDQTEPAVLRSLAALAPREAVAPLVSIAADPSREIRRLALEALLAAADPRSVVVLDRALVDPEPAVVARGAALAGRLRARSHTAMLAALMAHPDGFVRAEAIRALGAVGGVQACAALARAATTTTDVRLGEALEAAAEPACVPAILTVLRNGRVQPALVRGLAAAASGAPGGEVVPPLLEALAGEPATAELAADALAAARLSHRQASEVAAAFEVAPGPVRARLCPALASSATGRARLAVALGDRAEDDEVRAAAAWALAGTSDPGPRAALEQARASLHPALAANAQAALQLRRGPAAATVQLRSAAGRALPGQWLQATLPGGPALWARTGSAGRVRLSGLGGPVTVSAASPELSVADAGDGLGKIAGDEVPGAEGVSGLVGGQPVEVDPGSSGVQHGEPLSTQRRDYAGEHVPASRRPK